MSHWTCLVFGHDFRSVYDTAPDDTVSKHITKATNVPEGVLVRNTYRGDVCRRCGKVTFNQKPNITGEK